MTLNATQKAAIKADILANQDLNSLPNTPDGAFAIAELYNLQASPDFYTWKTSVSTADVKRVLVWTEYRDTAVADKQTFELMISNGEIDPSDLNIRQGIADLFNGPQTETTRDNLINLGKRLATRIEALLAVGTGSEESPATMTLEGNISYQDVYAARNS